jgi:hypothetical protein
MTLADLALDGSTGLERAEPPVRRRGRRLLALVAIATVIGLLAARARRRHSSFDAEDPDGI